MGAREPQPPPSAAEELGLLFLFTVDTECSILRQPNPNPDRVIDELIFGDFGNGRRPAGIGFQMDLLEHFGFRGCFFVDVLLEYRYGQRGLERVIEAIAERGHEIQLHVHADPTGLGLSSDPVASRLGRAWPLVSDDQDLFRRLIELSVDLFERRVGSPPLAYRAGGFRIADAHFPVLEEFGIRMDSSVQADDRSRVPSWMHTRTQPFWVGGVLEVPPTKVLLADGPGALRLRDFEPRSGHGEAVSRLSALDGPPRVATYVSHSFELLRRRDTSKPEEIASFVERLRPALPAAFADRLAEWSPGKVRTFGEEIDDRLVTSLGETLSSIADCPDARCVTCTEIATLAERFWPAGRLPAVDPIPLRDPRRGVDNVTGTRIYSGDLLAHIAVRRPAHAFGAPDCDPDWIEVGGRSAEELAERIETAAEEAGPEAALRVCFRTLGVAAPSCRGALPPLAEALFPTAALRAVAAEVGAEAVDSVAWDVPTFVAWLEERGFEIIGERRVERSPAQLAALEPFTEKLKWLDPLEIRTAALQAELRRSRPRRSSGPSRGTTPRTELADGEFRETVVMPRRIEPASLPALAAELFESTLPGRELLFSMPGEPAPASRTTVVLALTRVGFEVLDRVGSGYRLIRPLELPDLRRCRDAVQGQ